MAPNTPKKRDSKTPRREWDTIKRNRFFDAFDSAPKGATPGEIAHLPGINIPSSTARGWLSKREQIGQAAIRRTRRTSSILGRNSLVSAADLAQITNQNNLIHEMGYRDQVEKLDSRATPRTLRHHANKAGAKRFKKQYQVKISKKNQELRRQYGNLHLKDTLTGFWQWVWFTDEAHFQSIKLAEVPEYELRYPGQEGGINESKATNLDVTVHVSAGISYNHKGRLIFYKDPVEPTERQRRQVKEPKQLKYELDSVYQERLKVWQDLKAKESETLKGNCMSHVFYAQKILPQHIEQIQALQKRHGIKYHLQEDGDPSHGTNSPESPPAILRRDAGLLLLIHPPQSPDLNPIEACWNIMKGRLAGKKWSTVAQFKADIQAEWDRITIKEIRDRIREMRQRCNMINEHPEVRIQSALW